MNITEVNFMKLLKVVCGIILNENKILIVRRRKEKSLGGYWEFPGGKIEASESDVEALCRELIEELGMKVENVKFFITSIHKYDSGTIELIAYTCKFIDATFDLVDHDAFEWIEISDLINWKLAPADIPIAHTLMKRGATI